jgi:hypothetical protein
MFGKIRRHAEPPRSPIPMQSVEGTLSIHTTPTVLITIDRAVHAGNARLVQKPSTPQDASQKEVAPSSR